MVILRVLMINKSICLVISKFLISTVFFVCYCVSSCQSQSVSTLDLYSLKLVDSFKIRKYAQKDEINQYLEINNRVVFYSKDSVCIGIFHKLDSSLKRVDFLPKDLQFVKAFDPFVVNFGQLDDSTLVVAYESRWPYVEDKIFLLNVFNLKISQPFYAIDSNFVSKYDTSFHNFNEAHDAFKTWFAVSNYSLPVRSSDTTVFMPVYTGELVNKHNGQFRPLKNCVIPISTQYRECILDSLDISFSKVNSIFNDSFLFSDDFYTMTRCRTTVNTDSTFIVSFIGSNHIVEYNYNSRKTKVHLLDLPLSEHSDLLVNKTSKSLDDVLDFGKMCGNKNSKYFYRGLAVPFVVNKKSPPDFRHFLYDRQFKMIGAFNLRIFQKMIRGIEADVFICFDKSRSFQDSNWMYFYKYKIIETNETCHIDSFLNVNLMEFNRPSYKSENYLSDLKIIEKNLDSIPVLICDNYCPTCVHKIGEFIKTIQTLKYSFKPFIIQTGSAKAFNQFMSDYQIRNDTRIYIDSLNLFSKLNRKVDMGLFLKQSKENYYFKPFKVDELEDLLTYICPKVKIVKGFCIPLEGNE